MEGKVGGPTALRGGKPAWRGSLAPAPRGEGPAPPLGCLSPGEGRGGRGPCPPRKGEDASSVHQIPVPHNKLTNGLGAI